MADMEAAANVFAVRCKRTGDKALFVIDEDGDLFADGSAATVFDEYPDVELCRSIDHARFPETIIRSKWDAYVGEHRQLLAEAKILGLPTGEVDEVGSPIAPLLNVTGLQRLHNGAIWQLYTKHKELEERVEQRLLALEGPSNG